MVFFAAPVALIIYYSFGYKPGIFGTVATDKLSFDQYVEAFNPNYTPIFRNTLEISILGTFLCLVIGLPFAYWLAVKVQPKWRGLLLGLVLVPFWTNFLVRTIGWQIILAPDGFLSGFLQDIKAVGEPVRNRQDAMGCPGWGRVQLSPTHDPAAVCCFRPVGFDAQRS